MLDAKTSVWLRDWIGYGRAIVLDAQSDCIGEYSRVGWLLFAGFGGVSFLLALFDIAFA